MQIPKNRGVKLSILKDEVENLLNNERDCRDRYYGFFIAQEEHWEKLFRRWDEVKRGWLLTRAFIRRVYLGFHADTSTIKDPCFLTNVHH
jgi:hypothetical protein